MERKRISFVKENSYAQESGIKAQDILLSVNGQLFNDIIDLSFLFADEYLELEILSEDGQQKTVVIEKHIDDDLGLEFEQAVFDSIKTCHNNCVFCFVEQMAPNMRNTLYVKDDDYRLSFLTGNFITLTNVTQEDKNRILQLKLSPLYVSIHATDAQVRQELIRNNRAGEVLKTLKELGAGGIKFHTQIVLCPGINDGLILEKSFKDLFSLNDSVLSIAVVPVGLTKFCQNPLRNFNKDEAKDVVAKIRQWQEECRTSIGRSFIHAADEFYVLADEDFPAAQFYDGFCQYENGIGICRKFIDEWQATKTVTLNAADRKIVCGQSAQKVLNGLLGKDGVILPVQNEFFGHSVTVTGLLTGNDIIEAVNKLENKPECVIIPGIALKSKSEQIFLDDMGLHEVKQAVGCDLKVIYEAGELKKFLSL